MQILHQTLLLPLLREVQYTNPTLDRCRIGVDFDLTSLTSTQRSVSYKSNRCRLYSYLYLEKCIIQILHQTLLLPLLREVSQANPTLDYALTSTQRSVSYKSYIRLCSYLYLEKCIIQILHQICSYLHLEKCIIQILHQTLLLPLLGEVYHANPALEFALTSTWRSVSCKSYIRLFSYLYLEKYIIQIQHQTLLLPLLREVYHTNPRFDFALTSTQRSVSCKSYIRLCSYLCLEKCIIQILHRLCSYLYLEKCIMQILHQNLLLPLLGEVCHANPTLEFVLTSTWRSVSCKSYIRLCSYLYLEK